MQEKKQQQDANLSTELAQAQHRIHIESLKREAARLNDGNMECGDKQKQQQDEVLSTKLAQADRRIHIENLKREAARLNNGNMSCGGSEKEEHLPILEKFWERVVAYEKAPLRSFFAQLQEAGVALPPPDSLDDAQLKGKLWQVIHKLAELCIFLSHTDHLSDRELYVKLWDDTLREEETVLPDEMAMDCFIDVLGDCCDEGRDLALRYYDNEWEREEWAAEYPEMTLPPSEKPPFSRDKDLPQRDYNPN